MGETTVAVLDYYCYVDVMTTLWQDLTKKGLPCMKGVGAHLQTKSLLALVSWGWDGLALQLET